MPANAPVQASLSLPPLPFAENALEPVSPQDSRLSLRQAPP